MTTQVVIFVCDDAIKAGAAVEVLTKGGFTASQIAQDTVTNFTYDAQTYSGGVNDGAANKIVVTGRR